MNYLYILSESDNDDLFFKGCVERITGRDFELMPIRIRKSRGIEQVRKHMPRLLQNIQYTGHVESTFFLIALDNDRSPVHPHHKKNFRIDKISKRNQNNTCRFCEIEKTACQILGTDREKWPIRGAIAVPVQMLESWLLLICNCDRYQDESALPIFSKKRDAIAQHYYAPKKPPDQLKDLWKLEKKRLNQQSNPGFCEYCAAHLVPQELEKISESFRLFKAQVEEWFHKGTTE